MQQELQMKSLKQSASYFPLLGKSWSLRHEISLIGGVLSPREGYHVFRVPSSRSFLARILIHFFAGRDLVPVVSWLWWSRSLGHTCRSGCCLLEWCKRLVHGRGRDSHLRGQEILAPCSGLLSLSFLLHLSSLFHLWRTPCMVALGAFGFVFVACHFPHRLLARIDSSCCCIRLAWGAVCRVCGPERVCLWVDTKWISGCLRLLYFFFSRFHGRISSAVLWSWRGGEVCVPRGCST
jgi:hypothetical protein